MGKRFLGSFIILLNAGFFAAGHADVRIKDIAAVENSNHMSLIGYGLVVGLDGSGDRTSGNRGAVFTVQSISNMLEKFGITVPQRDLRTRNVAAVMVTAQLPAFGRVGSQFDVTVSSLGDAKSLEGGVLLMTPLMNAQGDHYAMAQGPVSIGGYNIETTAGEKLRKNHALVGRIPLGGYLIKEAPQQTIDFEQPLRLQLLEPDFVTAQRIADAINMNLAAASGSSANLAHPLNPNIVELSFPDTINTQYQAVRFVAALETLSVQPDMEARVIINERTGTIVAGGSVTIGEVMISHSNLIIHTRRQPIISQPAPFSRTGQTVVEQISETQAEEGGGATAALPQTTTVQELAEALNQLGLKPRDIIAIFQAIKQAGALRARLIII